MKRVYCRSCLLTGLPSLLSPSHPPHCSSSILGGVPVVEVKRSYLHCTPPRRFNLELNPANDTYAMEEAFETPTFHFYCEGGDVDFKKEVREKLLELMPSSSHNFTQRRAISFQSRETLQLFRSLHRHQFANYAMVRSSMQRLLSYYEVLATADYALALLAAEHFTFGGLVYTHFLPPRDSPEDQLKQQLLEAVDSGRSIGCVAQRELIAEEVPLNTEARYDFHDQCFYLRGTGKFSVVAADVADWAIVSATLTLNKKENNGKHLFLVQLREGGVLRKGIEIKPISSDSPLYGQCGASVIFFDSIALPKERLLAPFRIDVGQNKLDYLEGQKGRKAATEVLRVRERLATGALLLGALKVLNTNVLLYVSNKYMLGPDHRRNYPYMGFQHVQSPLVSLVAKTYIYIGSWHRLLPTFCDVAKQKKEKGTYDEEEETAGNERGALPLEERVSYEDDMRLAGLLYFMQNAVYQFKEFSDRFIGVHASLESSGLHSAVALVHLRQEGSDHTRLIREVALKSVIKNIGTTHWGWWLTSLFEKIPSLDRFVKNPWYSPRIADLGRHLMFFSHKHYGVKKRLRQSRELERRKGGSEHQWYDWHMFRHQEVVHCGESFMEMFFMEVIMAETEACSDPRGRKLLRDIGWVFALTRQVEAIDFILLRKMLSPGKGGVLLSHVENIITVLAPQCVPLVKAMEVPPRWCAPMAIDMERYWTIPGTHPHIVRTDTMTTVEYGRTKEEQENIKEEEDEFDLFHGLADKPSYAYKGGEDSTRKKKGE